MRNVEHLTRPRQRLSSSALLSEADEAVVIIKREEIETVIVTEVQVQLSAIGHARSSKNTMRELVKRATESCDRSANALDDEKLACRRRV
ncbi:hypothetical protein BC832DRAFT_121870 [Gaertneriomyces semiglobifer]|nr:hypothetical protein BC832DRAFT_121870 [Gaertneriomyces semiglobifer]